MKIAIMQPYFFPYIGYWQLINAVDLFVIYDDVNYIKGGWINRNRILINGKATYLTVPLYQSSPNKRICDITLQPSLAWRDKLAKMVENTYRRAPYFAEVFPVIERIIRHEGDNLAEYLTHQLKTLSGYLGIETEIVMTSSCYENNDLSGQERIIDICKRERTSIYINLQGGQTLYDTESFRSADIDLRFIVMRPLTYRQRSSEYVPYLSIIDVLMELGPVEMKPHLQAFDLVEAEKRLC